MEGDAAASYVRTAVYMLCSCCKNNQIDETSSEVRCHVEMATDP